MFINLKFIVFAAISVFAFATASAADIIYVNQAAKGSKDGSSWANAFTSLQPALQAAKASPAGDVIWVAKGTYKPSVADAPSAWGGNKTFVVPDGTKIFGGFNGSETKVTQRDPVANPTILSGDLGSSHAWHVVTIINAKVALDSLTIRGGIADGVAKGISDTANNPYRTDGGGIFISGGQTDLNNVTLKSNQAKVLPGVDRFQQIVGQGGGVYVKEAKLNVTSSFFGGNTAADGNWADVVAGGVASLASDIKINDSTFKYNSAFFCGTMFLANGNLDISNSQILNNTGQNSCAGIYVLIGNFKVDGQDFNASSTTGAINVVGNRFADNIGYDCGALTIENQAGGNLSPALISGNVFENNRADHLVEGNLTCGAICLYSEDANIIGNKFLNNKGVTGGSICAEDIAVAQPTPFPGRPDVLPYSPKLHVSDNFFKGNAVTDPSINGSGAIELQYNVDAKILDNQFKENQTPTNGGGIASYSSNALIQNNTFEGNSAAQGGAVYAENSTLNDVDNSNAFVTPSDTVVIQ